MTHEQQNTEKENHTIKKLAHKMKLELYDVNKDLRMKNGKW